MEKEEKVQVQAGQEKQPEGQKKKMKTRTKVIAGVAVAALACGVGTGAYLITKNGGIEELLEDSPLADLADKIKGDDVDAGSAGNQDKDGADGASGAGGASGTDGAVQQTGYVDNGGAQVGGTSASNSYPIKMSDLCTFSDPSGLSFDTRYVLHGGSDCIPAKRIASTGYSCKEAYVILYARGGQAVGQYECYVMNSEADAKGVASALAAAYGFSCGNWGDVAYMYTPGSYVQESISTYYKQGVIKSETPAAYLGMQFYFGGMSEYQPPASSGGSGGGGGSTPGGSTPGGTTPGGNTPGGNTPGGDTPVGPEEPDQPDEPDDPDTPDPSGETSVAVTDEQLTDKLEEALATADNSFPVEITDKYTFEDPEGLEYDTRYVLYGGEGSGAVTAVSMAGATANGVYDIYYLKDGEIVRGYRCFDAASTADAEQLKAIYGYQTVVGEDGEPVQTGMGEAEVAGRVTVLQWDPDMLKMMISVYSKDGTPEGYMQALKENDGYCYFRNPNPAEEPSDELTGTTPEEAFNVKVSDSYTFDEAQVLPGTAYDRRYVLYGDETNGFAAQQGAEAFYDVIYEQSSQALYEIKIYVMPGEEEAQTLAGQLVTAGMDAKVMPGTDAVLVIGRDLQETIDTYVESGLLSEATPRAYIEGFLMKLGMTEVMADGNALSCTSLPQADLNRLLYEAEGLLETSGTQWNETEFEPLIPAPGVLDPEADLSSESVAQAAREAEAFDPADAGVMAEDAGQQDSFDPASAGNAGQAADGQSEMAQAAEGASQGEVFDPSTAGSVPAGTDGTGAAGEAAADGGTAEESGGTALTAGATADWNDPDFDDAADRLRAGSAAGPQELAIGEGICFADPQDLEFDTRLVYWGDARSALAAELSAQRQMTVSCVYEIVYVKNGQAAAQYRCIVAGDHIFCQRMKPEKLAERISALPAGQPAFEASLQGYTGWMQQIEQLEEYKEGEETR